MALLRITDKDDIQRRAALQVVPCLAPEMAIRRAHLLYNEELREMLERSAVEEVVSAPRAAAGAASGGVSGCSSCSRWMRRLAA
jgi:hypothetical protein